MSLHCYPLAIITEILQSSAPLVSKWKGVYLREGITGLNLGYAGPKPLLSPGQKSQVLAWLKEKNYWNLNELACYLLAQAVWYQTAV